MDRLQMADSFRILFIMGTMEPTQFVKTATWPMQLTRTSYFRHSVDPAAPVSRRRGPSVRSFSPALAVLSVCLHRGSVDRPVLCPVRRRGH